MIDYVVAHGTTVWDLQKFVERRGSQGYEPIGGVAVAVVPYEDAHGRPATEILLYQAMCRRVPDQESGIDGE